MIYQPEYIKKILNEQKLEVLVISYGGSCSEALQRALTNSNINSIIPLHAEGHVEWEHAVHLPFYYKMNIPIIYVYDDIRKAFLSQNLLHKFGRPYAACIFQFFLRQKSFPMECSLA